MMQALIIAAGRGTRLGELTQHQPKCLVKVAGQPLLAHILNGLVEVGVQRVIVAVGAWESYQSRMGSVEVVRLGGMGDGVTCLQNLRP